MGTRKPAPTDRAARSTHARRLPLFPLFAFRLSRRKVMLNSLLAGAAVLLLQQAQVPVQVQAPTQVASGRTMDQLVPLVVTTLVFALIGILLVALAYWIIIKV